MHGIGRSMPVKDNSQDYKLKSASQNSTHTTLCFSRKFITGDKYDVDITVIIFPIYILTTYGYPTPIIHLFINNRTTILH